MSSGPVYHKVGRPLLIEEGKLPPQAPEIEEQILGAVLLVPKLWSNLSSILRADQFYVQAHSLIWKSFERLAQRGASPDMMLVVDDLRTTGELDNVGGVYAISTLSNKVGGTANAEVWARVVVEKWIRRKLIEMRLVAKPEDEERDVFDVLELVHAQLADINSCLSSNDPVSAAEVLRAMVDNNAVGEFIPFFMGKLDDHSSMGPGNMAIIGARPSIGKTTLALVAARNLCMRGYHVGFLSLEMTKEQLVAKAISPIARINSERAVKNTLTEAERDRMAKALIGSADWLSRLHIDDRSSLHSTQIPAKLERLKRRYNTTHVFIDYVQLASGTGERRLDEVTNISKAIKSGAKSTGQRVVALSQLARGEHKEAETRPTMSMLRDSGQLEADGDLILLLGRHLRDESQKESLMVFCDKNKYGPTGHVVLRYDLEHQDIYPSSDIPVPKREPVKDPHDGRDDDAPF